MNIWIKTVCCNTVVGSRLLSPVQNVFPTVRYCSKQPSSSKSEASVPKVSSTQSEDARSSVTKYVQADDNISYKVPEYYQHNTMSYVDYEVEMLKYRIPQPSSVTENR